MNKFAPMYFPAVICRANLLFRTAISSIHSFPLIDSVAAYLDGFHLFLEMYPIVSVQFISIISTLSNDFLRQETTGVLCNNHPLSERYPLIAALCNLVLCLGGHYSENYNERLAKVLYDNGKKYFLKSSSSCLGSSVRAVVVFILVYGFLGLTSLTTEGNN